MSENNKTVRVHEVIRKTSIDEILTRRNLLNATAEQIATAKKEAEDKLKSYGVRNKKLLTPFVDITSFGTLIAFPIVGTKAKDFITRKGYYSSYVVNLENPMCSEMGDIYVDITFDGVPYRVLATA